MLTKCSLAFVINYKKGDINLNNELIENVVANVVTLETIHNDLGAIVAFLVFFTLVIILYFGYKFFDMIWKF